MKIITAEECGLWIQKFRSDALGRPLPNDHAAIAYAVPKDSSLKTCLARSLVEAMTISQPGLLWITGWSIFPSGENMELFRGYRLSLGEPRPVNVAPGHIFDNSDRSALEALLALTLYFYWDAVLLEGDGGMAVKLSHDEWIKVHSTILLQSQAIQDRFDRIGLKRLEKAQKDKAHTQKDRHNR